ncbi:PhzF family phenazine biosynthesis protein [Formosa algae]|uniref:PhzF family phenazine biosynthesis protein n=1 Tax=Formosa algae TaxID=225843 RepID=A0A9X1CB89_9FLAO|nr:PhzF family phenazine biosynthesis protein [Formosa algae]MBP1838879.1 PhzF family phenazine biosynthesis protein [Formosa algae]MDQ0333656.1 PhzF family phenazine biosynthesis protein [Formosa algae]
MTISIDTYIVDSFTDKPFKGNPAGVCLVTQKLSDKQMQLIAKELGLSETAFITKTGGLNTFTIRFFSPKMEIPLCGHATLAASKVCFELYPEIDKIHFKTIQNLDLIITKHGKTIAMAFPVYHTIPQHAPKALLDALGLHKISNSEYNSETNILLLEIESSEVLKQLSPDFERLKRAHNSINGVLVTARSQRHGFDFESRYFWPWSGTNEDPVTGGTHTFLAKYWSERLNKKKMNSYQCSERTGFMEVELIGNDTLSIKSQAQIVFKGALRL